MPLALNRCLRASGRNLVDGNGNTIRLRGMGLGGWMNMENFITGYAANEQLMRHEVESVLGHELYEAFFDRLLTVFFDDADAHFLGEIGMNCVRVPINYHHFEDDARPFELIEEGFAQLDRVIDVCARNGLYTVIDLHALPGAQNQHWHSDNPTHVPNFWVHRHFQDRAVWLWEAIADRYRGDARVAGYNPINEPASEDRELVASVYRRLYESIRAVDGDHLLFLDGNTYSTEFDVFTGDFENVVYTCHDYAAAGFITGGDYPGLTDGQHWDRAALERKYFDRTRFSRETETPVWIGEFGPVYVGDERRDAMRYRILTDQLEIYGADDASWSLWTYKDVGRQGLAVVGAATPYRQRFDGFIAKKDHLGADHWGSSGDGVAGVLQPVFDLMSREFPDYSPYPWGMREWARTLLMHITMAEPLAHEYAALFAGLDEDAVRALADSFAFDRCDVREPLEQLLRKDLADRAVENISR